MDWSAWKKALELYASTPELIAASIVSGIAIFWFAWRLRTHISKEHVAALNTQITSLEGRLQDPREDLRIAKEEQQRITKEVEVLRTENAKLVSEIKTLQATASQAQQASLTIIYNRASAIAVSINSIGQANTTLGSTLSVITDKLEATEGSDPASFSAKPALKITLDSG
jgi:chromosome segregation ATPase